jgi:hypothetical protein
MAPNGNFLLVTQESRCRVLKITQHVDKGPQVSCYLLFHVGHHITMALGKMHVVGELLAFVAR